MEVRPVAAGTINRRVDLAALVADITTANTIAERKDVFARLVQPLWQKLSGLYTAQQLKARVQNLGTAWTVARDAQPYVLPTALANVQALAGELNQMEDEAILAEAANINVTIKRRSRTCSSNYRLDTPRHRTRSLRSPRGTSRH